MLNTQSKLITEFLKDHQQFSRLLFEIEKLLGKNDFRSAKKRAIELNHLAGPHIAFEEAELYPRLRQLGENSVTQDLLVGQHRNALQFLQLLIDRDHLGDEDLDRVRKGIQDAMAHAEHCGSLISLMALLDESEQSASLEKLERLRKEGKLWTDL